MMPELMRKYVGLREVARSSVATLQLVVEAKVDVDLLVHGTVERSHRRLSEPAARLRRIPEEHQLRGCILLSLVCKDLRPRALRIVEHKRDKLYFSLFACRVFGTQGCVSAGAYARLDTQVGEKISSSDEAEGEDDNSGADSEPAAHTSAAASSILEIFASSAWCPAHLWPPPYRLRLQASNNGKNLASLADLPAMTARLTKLAIAFAAVTAAHTADAQSLVPVNLYVADITYNGGSIQIGKPRKLTGDRGIASQPSFTPDGKAILYVSRRDSVSAQSDIYRIDLASGIETRITSTPEMENSPTVTPDGQLMVIRWIPATLFREWGPWVYDMKGTPLRGVLPGPDTVGYYVRVDSTRYAMVRPKSRTAVAVYDSRAGSMTDYDWPVANLPPQLIRGDNAISYTRTDSLGRNQIRRLDLRSLDTSSVTPTVPGRTVHAWALRGSVLMGKGNTIFVSRPASREPWKSVASFSDPELQSVATYVVSPAGDKVILISPVKPALSAAIRDSLQAGVALSAAMKGYAAMPAEDLLARYDVAEGALLGIASEQTAKGNAADAIPLIRMTIGAFPKAYAPHLVLGNAYRKLGDEPNALAAYRRSIELNPKLTESEKRDADRAQTAITNPERK